MFSPFSGSSAVVRKENRSGSQGRYNCPGRRASVFCITPPRTAGPLSVRTTAAPLDVVIKASARDCSRFAAGQSRDQAILQFDAVGELFAQHRKVFAQRAQNFTMILAIVLVVEIEYRLRDFEHARINLLGDADDGHSAFTVLGEVAIELEVCLRGVIDQRLTKTLHQSGHGRVGGKRKLPYQLTVARPHLGASVHQYADQIGRTRAAITGDSLFLQHGISTSSDDDEVILAVSPQTYHPL